MDPRKRSKLVMLTLMGALATATATAVLWPVKLDQDCASTQQPGETKGETVSRGGFGEQATQHCGG